MNWLSPVPFTIVFAFLSIMAYIAVGKASFCKSLLSSQPDVYLRFSPKELTLWHISLVITFLVVKSLAQSVGIGSKLRFAQDGQSAPVNDGSKVKEERKLVGPLYTISMPFHVDESVIAEYKAAVGTSSFDVETTRIENIGLFYSAASVPPLLLLLAKRTCPIRPLGAVNVRSRFEVLHPDACRRLLLPYGSAAATVRANLLPVARKVKRGYEFDLTCEIISGEPESILFRQKFTMLQFVKHAGKAATRNTAKLAIPSEQTKSSEQFVSQTEAAFSFAFKDPLLWARICKDYNPIHISRLAAQCFGFSGKIAHGTHVVAKAFSAMNGVSNNKRGPPVRSGQSGEERGTENPLWIEVDFKRPMQVPSTFSITIPSKSETLSSSDYWFQIQQKGKACVDVRLGLLQSSNS